MAELTLDLELLTSILSQPTAPFRERHVISLLKHRLASSGVPHFSDAIGNIVVGVESEKKYRALLAKRDPREPLRLFIAHMDHPGFHGASWLSPTRLAVKWHGGTPVVHLQGADVWLGSAQGWETRGTLQETTLLSSGRALDTAVIEVPEALSAKFPEPAGLFGGFRFREPVWKEGKLIYTKAADDLVGAFAIVSLARHLWQGRKRKSATPPFIGLLTRAEEVGFIGAIGHFERGYLARRKRDLLCVSLETSRTLPGAEIGKGPIVRLGDRSTVFDPGALRVFSDLALKSLPDAHQRRIMDGGSCEATAATAYGLPAIGISIPLGNYHNQGFEGGPDCRGPEGPAPEFVHLDDVQGLLRLCVELLEPRLPWHSPWESRRKLFKKSLSSYRKLLQTGP
ncbi:MAG: hypothetical protein NDJ90_12375 [Oligoflexia bacterium]|nr:hypothetical protein [Oligoflexia bacterium]